MIPGPHRNKGGAMLLGATGYGEHGPYGPYGAQARDPGDMDIEVLVVPDCPNEKATAERLRQALDDVGLPDTVVTTRVIADQAEAERTGFTGSPTILLNGHDPFAEPGRPPGLACRVYRTPHGLAGVPELGQLQRALAAAAGPAD